MNTLTGFPDRHDRCDRCPATAYTDITLKSGGHLQLCKHHTDQHEVALAAQGANIERKV